MAIRSLPNALGAAALVVLATLAATAVVLRKPLLATTLAAADAATGADTANVIDPDERRPVQLQALGREDDAACPPAEAPPPALELWQLPCKQLFASQAYQETTSNDALPVLLYRNNEESGLADNFVGSVSMFAMALMHRRRFYLSYDILDLGVVQPAFPRWNWTGPLPPISNAVLGIGFDTLENRTAELLAANSTSLVALRVNRGALTHAFKEGTPLARFLRSELGLSVHTAFACLHGALYGVLPRLFTVGETAIVLNTLQTTAKMRVGIQIRTNDAAFKYAADGTSPTWQYYSSTVDGYVRCALRVAAEAGEPAPVLLLVTDNVLVRKHFADMPVPDGVERLLATRQAVKHVSPAVSPSADWESMTMGVAEHTLLSMVDYWVVTLGSGFGLTAAARAVRSNGRVYDGGRCAKLDVYAMGMTRAGI